MVYIVNFTKIYNNITVPFEQMREIRKELDRFVKPIQIEVIKSDFETVSFAEIM